MRSYVRTFKCENVNVRSVRNEDCESGYVRSRPYIPICEPEGRDRVEKENPDGAQCFSQLAGGDLLPIKSETTMGDTVYYFYTQISKYLG